MAEKQCYGCDKRYVGCHSTCESYLQYRKELDEYNAKIQADKALQHGFVRKWRKVRGKWRIK